MPACALCPSPARAPSAGTVTSGQNFSRLNQCNGFTECHLTWTCGGVRDNLWEVTHDGTPPPQHAGHVTPPVGIRSAVPLGGLGTGTFELRADGSFADWQVENQGPALATNQDQNSKLPLKDEALLAIRVEETPIGNSENANARREPFAAPFRTDPPPGVTPSASSLEYTGAYPFSRLVMVDPELPVTAAVYAFSAFKLWDENASAAPAVAFTLVVTNPRPKGSPAQDVSFMLSLPLASAKDTTRHGTDGVLRQIPDTSPADCLHACATEDNCTSWNVGIAVPGAPARPATIHNNTDCPGGDLFNVGRSSGMARVDDCVALCNHTATCVGFVWDTIPKELAGQCHGKPGQGCCLLKSSCGKFATKQGDTVHLLGKPAKAAVPPQCTLRTGAPAVEQFRPGTGAASGVKGKWKARAAELIHTRTNPYVASTTDPAAAVASFSLRGQGPGAGSVGDVTTTMATGDTLAELWEDFAKDGALGTDVDDDNAGRIATAAAHGAVATTVTVQPGETKTITLVFGWSLPNRLYSGEELGNYYRAEYPTGSDASAKLSGNIAEVAADAAKWNAVWANSTFPVWLKDFMLNSLATQPKMGIWVADQHYSHELVNGLLPGTTANGRYRTYEAFSGCDLDPVHVSDYHQIPYATFFPALTKNVIFTGWATEQLGSGMVQEVLGSMGSNGRLTGAMDTSAGGRTMSDTTTIFILDTYQVYLNTGDTAFLGSVYPHIARAAWWQINRTIEGHGFPHHLQNTYDYLGLDKFANAAYSGFTHMAAMRATVKLVEAMGDRSGLAAAAKRSDALCLATMNSTLWTGTHWRAAAPWPHGDTIMSGTLHGQSWALLLGLGHLAPSWQLESHIRQEVKANCAYDPEHCAVGQLTLPGAPSQAGWAADGSPSMNFDNAACAVWIANATLDDPLLLPAKSVVELYRSTLHDVGLEGSAHGSGGENLRGPAQRRAARWTAFRQRSLRTPTPRLDAPACAEWPALERRRPQPAACPETRHWHWHWHWCTRALVHDRGRWTGARACGRRTARRASPHRGHSWRAPKRPGCSPGARGGARRQCLVGAQGR